MNSLLVVFFIAFPSLASFFAVHSPRSSSLSTVLLITILELIHNGEAVSLKNDNREILFSIEDVVPSHLNKAFISASPLQGRSIRSTSLGAQRWKYTRVTLLKDTPHVGKEGEVAIVNRNYAFNYLVPFGFARYTTRAELVNIALKEEYPKALMNIRKASAMDMKTRFGKDTVLDFEIPAEKAESDKLVSPLLAIHIIDKMRELKMLLAVDMLREQDIEILSEGGAITTFGSYKVILNADSDVKIEIIANVKEKPVDSSFIKDVIL